MRHNALVICLSALSFVACGTTPGGNTAQSAFAPDGAGGGAITGGGKGHVPKTTLAVATRAAGVKLTVTCTWSDTGKPITLAGVQVPADAKATTVDLSGGRFDLTATIVGAWPVACADVGLSQVDPRPPTLTVTPGPAVGSVASLASSALLPGEDTAVVCRGVDAYGNDISAGTFTVAVSPAEVASASGLTITATKIGAADVFCLMEGVDKAAAKPAKLIVQAGVVTRLVAKGPAGSTVVGDIAPVVCEAQDAGGNAVAVPAAWLSVLAAKPLNVIATGALGVVTTKAGKWPLRCALKQPALTSEPINVTYVAGAATSVGVVLAPSKIIAGGSGSKASCVSLDAFGNATPSPSGVATSVDDGEGWAVMGALVTSKVAGEHGITCSATGATLKKVPATLTVAPAPPAFTKGVTKPASATAGKPFGAVCTAFDALGNAVEKQPADWQVKAPASCTVAAGTTLTCTRATTLTLTCETQLQTGDAKPLEAVPFTVDVVPADPVSFKLKLDPEQPNYTTGQNIALVADAKDTYGNTLKDLALAPISVTPVGYTLDKVNAQMTCEQDGLYTVTASLSLSGPQGLA